MFILYTCVQSCSLDYWAGNTPHNRSHRFKSASFWFPLLGFCHGHLTPVFNYLIWVLKNIRACINCPTSLPTICCLVSASTRLFYFKLQPKNKARKEGRTVGEEFGPVHEIPQCSFLPMLLNKNICTHR